MKKIILSLITLLGTMSINAQVINVYKTEGGVQTIVGSYSNETNATYKVELSAGQAVVVGSQGFATATVEGGDVQVPWVQLWAGGPKFATYSVNSTATEGSKEKYKWGAVKPGKDPYTLNLNIAGTDHDAAKMVWGNSWIMPNKSVFEGLLNNCNYVEKKLNGVDGYVFTGKGDYAGNSLFLPVDGCYWTAESSDYNKKCAMLLNDNGSVYINPTYLLANPAGNVLAIVDESQSSPKYLNSAITITGDIESGVVKLGNKIHLFANPTPANASNQDYLWTIEDENVATITTNDGNNIWVEGKNAGQTKITAKSQDGTAITAEYTLTVDSYTFGAPNNHDKRKADAAVGDICWYKTYNGETDTPFGVVVDASGDNITIMSLTFVASGGYPTVITDDNSMFYSQFYYPAAVEAVSKYSTAGVAKGSWHVGSKGEFGYLTTTLSTVNSALTNLSEYEVNAVCVEYLTYNDEAVTFWTSTPSGYETGYNYVFYVDLKNKVNLETISNAASLSNVAKRYVRAFTTLSK